LGLALRLDLASRLRFSAPLRIAARLRVALRLRLGARQRFAAAVLALLIGRCERRTDRQCPDEGERNSYQGCASHTQRYGKVAAKRLGRFSKEISITTRTVPSTLSSEGDA